MFYRDVLLDELTALLAISTRYDFKEVRSQVIEEMSEEITSVPPVARIALDQQYGVGKWSRGALRELCLRPDPLDESEGHELGLATTVKVLKARERRQKGVSIDPIIDDIFQSKAQPTPSISIGKKRKAKFRKM